MKYDFIAKNAPINKTAKVVMQEGEHYIKDNLPQVLTSDEPIQTIQYKGSLKSNFTGKRFGKFVVVGFYGDRVRANGERRYGRWVVRCSCGRYEVRSSKTIRIGNEHGCCQYCFELESIKRKYRDGM